MGFAVQTWVVDRAGPVFVSVYLPVQTLLVAVMASVVSGEEFYLGGCVILPYQIILLFFVLGNLLCKKIYYHLLQNVKTRETHIILY